MKSNFKLSTIAAVIAFASSASAFAVTAGPSFSASADGSGRISTQTSTYAAVSGNGDSLSHAATQAGSYSTGTATATPSGIAINGAASGFVNAQAYNVKTGNGVGSASAGGWSDASFNGNANLTVPCVGFVTGMASIDGGMGNAVRNGVDAHVNAGTAQDGYAGGTYAGTVSLAGTTKGVNSTQTADGEAYAGGITFTGGTPAGQSAAARSANSGVDVSVTGSFDNSSHTPHAH